MQSSLSCEGISKWHCACVPLSWMPVKTGQSVIWPEGLVHVLMACWSTLGFQPAMKSP